MNVNRSSFSVFCCFCKIAHDSRQLDLTVKNPTLIIKNETSSNYILSFYCVLITGLQITVPLFSLQGSACIESKSVVYFENSFQRIFVDSKECDEN